jgi:uncharacterized membrane protein YcaP (DUF421 family)
MFFNNWHSLIRILVIGPCAYIVLIVLLRISGKRTLSKFNAFDMVITIALGSTFATVLLSKDVTVADGVLAFLLLAAMQFAATWLSVRSPWFSRLIKSEPRMLLYRGQFLHAAMRHERVTEGEILAAIRESGLASVDQTAAVVIETSGSITVVGDVSGDLRALKNIKGFPNDPNGTRRGE